ncbi:MAG: DUF3794 domain-containing protein [Clostridia bacterium]|nr:DUF3794 domain-containing protein [Clostridia bacterium]
MAFEPVYEQINYNLEQGNVKEQIKVEARTDVLSEEVQKVLSVNAFIAMGDCQTANGKAEYNGAVTFFISYVDQEGQIKKVECGAELRGVIQNQQIKEGCALELDTILDKVEWTLSGVKLCVNAIVTISAEITHCNQLSALVGGEGVISKSQELSCPKSLGIRQGVYPLVEQFDLSYQVKEVLSQRIKAVITAVQCGVGSIIVDGEALLSIIMLQNSSKSGIIKENRAIPFRMEIDCEEAMPNMTATATVKERSLKTDVSVDAQTGQSTVSISAQLQFSGEAFSTTQISVVDDCFCTDTEVEIEKQSLPYTVQLEQRCFSFNVGGRAFVEELPVGATLLAVCDERAEVVEKQCEGEYIKVTGILTANAIFFDGESGYFSRSAQTPFEIKELLDNANDLQTKVSLIADKGRARIISLTEIDLEAEIKACVKTSKNYTAQTIKEVRVLDQKRVCQSAISVYIAREGEELWSLAKRLNVSPEKLIETNKDLNFPLSGKERIVIYRQK